MWLVPSLATFQPRFSCSLNRPLIMTLFDVGHCMKLVTALKAPDISQS
jgi:hypothetical protein